MKLIVFVCCLKADHNKGSLVMKVFITHQAGWERVVSFCWEKRIPSGAILSLSIRLCVSMPRNTKKGDLVM